LVVREEEEEAGWDDWDEAGCTSTEDAWTTTTAVARSLREREDPL